VECFLLFVVLVALVTGVVALAAAAQSRADHWNRAWQTLAQRFGGVCMPAGWFGRPSVRFRYGTTHALINSFKQAGVDCVQVVINWPEPNFRCDIYPDLTAAASVLDETGGMGVAWDVFHHRYTIVGPDPELVRAFLSDGVRWQIERLRQMGNNRDVYVSLHRGRMLIRKRGLLRRFDELQEFTELALELYDQAMLTRMTGIEFVAGDQAQIIAEAVCRVCGDEIVTDMVFCRRCKTPHHLECWQYYGACAVYGCQETRWIAPRAAGPHQSR
jgi:hypothetical protein